MYLLQKLWIVTTILFSCSIFAQYTGVINSNRPGFSESPYSVGTGVYQFETSFFHRKIDRLPTFSRPEFSGVDFLFRTSFFMERLELNLNFGYQKGQIAFQNIFNSSYDATGIRNLRIAAKYLIFEQEYEDKSKEVRSWKRRYSFDWKRLIPSVAGYLGVHTGLENQVFNLYDNGGFSPKVGVLLQNDLSNDLNILTNIYYDRITTSTPELSYIITATYSLSDRWSTFFENQTISNKFKTSTNLGSGIAYLWNRNIQLNGSLRFVVDGRAQGYYASFGASYRLDRHVDDYKEVDANGNPIEEDAFEANRKRGFFGNLFKKKSVQNPPKLQEKTIESIRKNTNFEEKTIDNDSLQQGAKPKPGKYKKVKTKKKKDGMFGGLFGNKSKTNPNNTKKDAEKIENMSQKEIDKELRKLEKEQKKLERQQKKDAEKKKKEEAKKKRKEKKKKKDKDA